MLNNKIVKLLYNKNIFIKFLIVCVLAYIIYILYYKINERFVSYPSTESALYESNGDPTTSNTEIWTVPDGVTEATFTVIGGKGSDSKGHDIYYGIGGYGAKVVVTIPVNPDEQYIIGVGNNGNTRSGGVNPFSDGYFNGGSGYGSANSYQVYSQPGSGGAASTVFLILPTSPAVPTVESTSTTPVIIAGGGGGGSNIKLTLNKILNGGNGGINQNGDGGNGDDGLPTAGKVYGEGGYGNIFDNTKNNSVGTTSYYSNRGGGGGGGSVGGIGGIMYYVAGGAGGSYVNTNYNSSPSYSSSTSTDNPSVLINWKVNPSITRSPSIIKSPTTTLTTTTYDPTTTLYIPPTSPTIYSEGVASVWIVPPNVSSATFTVIGGKGGGLAINQGIGGGFGGSVKTTIPVISGTPYYIYVGKNGKTDMTGGSGGKSADQNTINPRGVFGGGNGGYNISGGGGAASFISTTNTSSLNPIIIASGGGGAGSASLLGGNGNINNTSAGGIGQGFYNNIGGSGGLSCTSYSSLNISLGEDTNFSSGGGGGGCNRGGVSPLVQGQSVQAGGGAGSSYVSNSINPTNILYATSFTDTPSIKIEWIIESPTTTQTPTTTYTPTTIISQSSELYNYKGKPEVWTVPSGVTSATFIVIGGKGGNGTSNNWGGYGGNVTSTISNLNPGDIYNIYVGNNGENGSRTGSVAGGNSSDENNLYGGGNGTQGAGGGGAASYIIGNNCKIIAGGGGGGSMNDLIGGSGCINNNGDGGNGIAFSCTTWGAGCGGIGGSRSSTTYTSYKGSDGGFSGSATYAGLAAGGSGGGFYGGSSSGSSAGGGAGGSYVICSNSSNTTYTPDNTGSPSILITYTIDPNATQSPTTTGARGAEALVTTTQIPTTTISQSSELYNYKGNPEVWTVPLGVTSATFTVIGGKGGPGNNTSGGYGAKVTTTIYNLILDDKYNIYVGNNGLRPLGGLSSDSSNSFSGGNGWNAGSGNGINGGGGGAASFITDNNNEVIIVSGGGGGGGGGGVGEVGNNGGNGGTGVNGAGGDGLFRSISYSLGGSSTSTSYTSHVGASAGYPYNGGGGGGFYGGNSINNFYSSGGAGGSYVISTNSGNTTYEADNTGSPSILITYTVDPNATQRPTTTGARGAEALVTTTQIPTTTLYVPPKYLYTGKSEVWNVPPDAKQATFTVVGGSGGYSFAARNIDKNSSGGFGGSVTTTIPVIPGTPYYIYVGQNGENSATGEINTSNPIPCPGGKSADASTSNPRGIFGGGNGGYYYGAGGGAASFISTTNSSSLNPIIIAGGGGGSGNSTSGGNGNINNTSAGGPGINYNSNKGGSGGNTCTSYSSSNISLGGDSNPNSGGGGGGCNGGGTSLLEESTFFGTGGGAGSSYVSASINSINTIYSTDTSGQPYILITWSDLPIPTYYFTTTTQYYTEYPRTTQYYTEYPTTTQTPRSTQYYTEYPTTTQTPRLTQYYTEYPTTTQNPVIQIYESPETLIYQRKYEGTSNVYIPVIYENTELFSPLNLYDDKYAKY